MKTVVVAVLLCAPSLAYAADTVAAPAPVEKEKKVCRSEESTGSLFVKRVCHTKTEWTALDAERQRAAESMNSRRNGNGVDLPR
ncbi:hypothetical protein [Sphingomonas sp. UYP23]